LEAELAMFGEKHWQVDFRVKNQGYWQAEQLVTMVLTTLHPGIVDVMHCEGTKI